MKKIVIILLLFLYSGCDILSTRDAELPDTQRKNYLPATTPDILFLNIKNSLKEKVLENYMASFVDLAYSSYPFIFIPASEAVASFPGLVEWSLQSEQQYFNNLLVGTKEDIPIILDLQNEIKSTMGDSAIY
ncbi:MAG: hypothetical protein L3J41_11035, partial [Melioribacteraceae bacterium]|nr:hypothetical protein [Melioribacteraceae bacterium]